MSVEALAIALHHSRAASPTTKLVLIGIANHDGDGGAWPAVATLARYAGCTPRQVQRAIADLEQLREVRRVRQAGGPADLANYLRPNLYEFLLACPPDCDGTTKHRTRRDAGIRVDLDGLDEGVTPVSPGGPDLSTGVTPVSGEGVTPVSPKPSREPSHRDSTTDQPQTARARVGWSQPCQDGRMDTHEPSRRLDGRCAFCGATRLTWEER